MKVIPALIAAGILAALAFIIYEWAVPKAVEEGGRQGEDNRVVD